MGYSPERAMAAGHYPPLPPKGWNSDPRPCPLCGKPVKGREDGMISHMKHMHRSRREQAMAAIKRAKITWPSEEEIRARNAEADRTDPQKQHWMKEGV